MTALLTRAVKGSALTYTEFDANIDEIEVRTGQGWNDLVQDVTVRTGSNAPSPTIFIGGISAYEFSPTTMNECFVNFHMRHDYIAGTMVYPHVHWSHNTDAAGVVRWGFEYTLARRNDSTGVVTFASPSTLYIEHTVALGETYQHHVNEAADGAGIAGTDLQEDAIIICRVFRDATHINDTYPDPIHLLTVDIHYECNTLSTPLRVPPFN
jgi:hypothetical protein